MDLYDHIELTESEISEALREGKIKKYFRLKNYDYWLAQEAKAIENHEEEKRLNRIKSSQLRTLNKGCTLPEA